MATSIAVTNKVNALINSEAARLGLPKEALVHSILVQALTDPALMVRAAGQCRYLDEKGSEALEKMGL